MEVITAPWDAKKGLKIGGVSLEGTPGKEGNSQVGLKERKGNYSSNVKDFGEQERRQLSHVIWRNSGKKGKGRVKYKYNMVEQKGLSPGGTGAKKFANNFLCSSSVSLVTLPGNKNVPDGRG